MSKQLTRKERDLYRSGAVQLVHGSPRLADRAGHRCPRRRLR
ncbi:MAG: hypothetical protein M0026_12640 [Nocardiopsaceae bacterium]|nr:hypothetical protein [Nocardiopsaceae bacterium]